MSYIHEAATVALLFHWYLKSAAFRFHKLSFIEWSKQDWRF